MKKIPYIEDLKKKSRQMSTYTHIKDFSPDMYMHIKCRIYRNVYKKYTLQQEKIISILNNMNMSP